MEKVQQIFIPGDKWVYYKIYTGFKSADWILTKEIYPFTKRLIKNEIITQFHFVRYSDPDFHIRLRFLLSDETNFGNTVHEINHILSKLVNKQFIWKIEISTYQREIERYNKFLIKETEMLFYIDSIYIILIINTLIKNLNNDFRWMIAILLIDKMLSDFKFNTEDKKELMSSMSQSFKQEFGFNEFNSKQFNKKYRDNKNIIYGILNKKFNDDLFNRLTAFVNQRSIKMGPIINNILHIIKNHKLSIHHYIGSYIHMTMNKLFEYDNRIYELIIYDFLRRYYTSLSILKQ